MGFLDHIRACNAYRAERFLPLVIDGTRIGWVRHDNVETLRRFPAIFAISDGAVAITAGGGFDALSGEIDRVIEALVAEGRIDKWRHEDFAVAPRWGQKPLFKLDRGAVSFFGIRAYGVHLNGMRRDAAGLTLWIGRRASDKRVAPNHGCFEVLDIRTRHGSVVVFSAAIPYQGGTAHLNEQWPEYSAAGWLSSCGGCSSAGRPGPSAWAPSSSCQSRCSRHRASFTSPSRTG